MHFWLSRGSILHQLSNILLSGRSTYGSRETELYSGVRRMFWEARMRLQTIYHIYATKGEITGMITRCDNLVCRASRCTYFQNMLWSVSRLAGLIFSDHSISTPYSLSEDFSKQTSISGSKMKSSPWTRPDYILQDGGTSQRVFQVSPNL